MGLRTPPTSGSAEDPDEGSRSSAPAGTPTGTAVHSANSNVNSALTGMFGRDALYMGLWAAQIFGAALVTPLVTRLMPQDQFGVLATANSVMQILSYLAGMGLSVAIQRQYATKNAAAANKLLFVAGVASVVVAALFYLTGPLWSRALGFADFSTVLKLVVVWGGTGALTNCALALLRSQDRLLRFGIVSLVQSVVAEAASLVLVARFDGSGAQLFVLGQVGAQVAALILGLAMARPSIPSPKDFPMVTAALRFALPLVPSSLSTFVLNVSDRLVVQKFLGASPVGAYQLAYNVGSAPMLLLGVLSTAWLPRMFGLAADRGQVLAASRNATYQMLPAITVGMAIGGPVLLRLWAPASYRPDDLRLTLVLIIISAIPFAGGLAAMRALLVGGRSGAVAVCNGMAAAVNLGLNFILVPHLELVGAALSTLIAYTLLWVALLHANKSLPIPSAPRILPLSLAAACVVALVAAVLPVGGAFFVGRLVLAVLAVGWLWRVIQKIRQGAQPEADAYRLPEAPLLQK